MSHNFGLQNFQWWKLIIFGISKDKVTNLTISRGWGRGSGGGGGGVRFQKGYPKTPLFGFFSGVALFVDKEAVNSRTGSFCSAE